MVTVAVSTALLSLAEGAGESGITLDDYVRGCAGFDFHSKWLSYGFNDNDDPLILPTASLEFFNTLTTGATCYMDLTDWGKNAGRGTGPFEMWEADYTADAKHVFTPADHAFLQTSVELGVGYRYEYYPSRCGYGDSQFWLGSLTLPDLWLVPKVVYERDVMLDNGTYVNLALSHSFELGRTLQLVPSVSQGIGDRKRVSSYGQREDGSPLDRAGFMDFHLAYTLEWRPFDNLLVSGYVAYTDFPFDRHIRESARRHLGDAVDLECWNFTAGFSVRIML